MNHPPKARNHILNSFSGIIGRRHLLLAGLCLWFVMMTASTRKADKIFICNNGEIDFISYAPLEVIKAKSVEMKGALDVEKRTFLFSLNVNTFKGFNSGLQQEHFNENYLETVKYPKAFFEGKIIEDIDLGKDGIYPVRAKGILDLHGIRQERIVKGTITVKENKASINAHFTVLLEDHNIKIPRVVYQKISPEIEVAINAVMKPIE